MAAIGSIAATGQTSPSDPTPEIAWKIPPDPCAAHANVRSHFFLCMRALIIAAILTAIAYQYFGALVPPKLWLAFPAMVIVPLFLLWSSTLLALLIKPVPLPVRFTARGIVWSFTKDRVVRWTQLDSYELPLNQQGDPAAVLHLKDGIKRQLPLPTDPHRRAAALEELSRRLPNRPPLPRFQTLKRRDWVLGLALVVVVAGSVRIFNVHAISKQHLDLGLLMLLVLGPGTWMSISLRGRRALAQRVLLAIVLNMVTLFLVTGVITVAKFREEGLL